MAYAALVSLAQTIDLIMNHHQHLISPQVRNQITSIDKHVIFLQAFLEDFPDKANSLEVRIREATHVAEDIIEFCMSEQIHESLNAPPESSSSVAPSKSKFKLQLRRRWERIQSRYASPIKSTAVGSSRSKFKHEYLRYDLHELKKVTKKIESIAEQVMEIKNSIIVKGVRRLGDSSAASSSSRVAAPVHKDAMIGFDDDLMEIKSRVCGGSSQLKVIPVFGMGGIGKTTLARNVYDDPLIMEHFHIRAWVTVSQDYNAPEIASALLVSMKVTDAKNDSTREHRVHQNLTGRRYLIVLDDIWSTKAWDDLQMMFPDDGKGSRIMLTTRLSDVATYADSSSPVHEMRLMDEDQSWNLLRQKLFKQDPCPVEYEYIGRRIARSCRGLPLAIVVISGILSTVDKTEAAWEEIAENVYSAISANHDLQFDEVLSLSYTHLPHHLRPCFLYMGGFPEDYEMRVSRLIKLWVAEGFLRPDGCNKSFEETAEEYLEDLVKRSLVLVTKRKANGKIKSFGIHDLIREMCIRKAEDEDFFLHVPWFLKQGIKIPRRVSIVHSDLDFLENLYGLTIRTVIYLEHKQRQGTRCSLGYFRLLRILDLSNAYDFFHSYYNYTSLPAQVFELFHLRYLAFDCPFKIPAAILNLRNLQTLIICSSKEWKYYAYVPPFDPLPVEIWRMPQLRHLVLCSPLPPFQEEGATTFALENLQTLSVAINFVCSSKILETIPKVKKLGVFYRAWRDDKGKYDDYQLHNLIHLQHLENLKLMIYDNFHCREKVNPVFPRTLKKLTMSGRRLPWKDMTIVGSLPNLEVLKLRDHACDGDTWETIEGEFCRLKFLLIEGSNLQHWRTESSHFPRLRCLVLRRCPSLSEIPDVIGDIPTLELIEVDKNDKSLVNSTKQIQSDQKRYGNDALQVRIV